MGRQFLIRLLGFLVIVVLLSYSGCGGRAPDSAAPLNGQADLLLAGEISSYTLAGVPADLADQLKAELIRVLEDRGTAKAVAAAPTGMENVVDDLTAVDNGTGGARLSWSYRNRGDYDQNSEVNLADLSPIGVHFKKNPSSPDWLAAQLADGDGNGEVNLADVTPVGINFMRQVGTYEVCCSTSPADYPVAPDDPDGPGTAESGTLEFTDAFVGTLGTKQFTFHVANHAAGSVYWVRPLDSESWQGCRSNSAVIGGVPSGRRDWWMFGGNPQHTRRSSFTGSATNALKWSYTALGEVRSSPAIGADGKVYFGDNDGWVYALNHDGTLSWAYSTGGEIWSSSPAIGTDGSVFIGNRYNKLHAINPDASEKWTIDTGWWWVDSPAIGLDGTIYANGDKVIYALYPDGTQNWVYATGDIIDDSPAIGLDGSVFVGCRDNNLHAINPDGSPKWTFATGNDILSSPAIGTDGTVYVGSCDNNLYAINPDGTLKWSYITSSPVNSSPGIGADGTVYVGGTDHNLYAIKPDGTLKWSYLTGGDIWSSPAIGADGTVYVGSADGNFYAIGSDGSLKWFYATGDIVSSSPAIGADGTVYVGCNNRNLYAFGP